MEHHPVTRVFPRWLSIGLAVTYLLALLSFLTHDLVVNPQYDNQVLWDAAKLIQSNHDGQLLAFFSTVRKYPLGYIMTYVSWMYTGLTIFGGLKVTAVHFLGRLTTMLFGLGTLGLLWTLSRRMTGTRAAVVLLLSSILWFQFSTAIRPHVPVAFWTLLAFHFSLQLRHRRSVLYVLGAFGSAVFAACTLQSGFLAFLFPLWGMLSPRLSWRNAVQATLLTVPFVLMAIACGYPFVLAGLWGETQTFGLDLGHDVGLSLDGLHLAVMGFDMLVSEPILLIFAGWGAYRIFRRVDDPMPGMVPIAMYCISFFLLFGVQSISAPRFFLPILPFLALIGARPYAHAPKLVRVGVGILLICAFLRLTLLGLLPNTFQQASSAAMKTEGLIGYLHAPSYFYGIPQSRMSTGNPLPSTVLVTGVRPPSLPGDWRLCKQYDSGAIGDESALLWVDAPWVWWYVFTAPAMGPKVALYCNDSFEQVLL